MQVKALILNHCDDPGNTSREPKERMITIPSEAAESWDKADDLGKLELVFRYGQNDFSVDFPEYNTTYSLSVGDVVCFVDRDYTMPADFDNDDVANYIYYVVVGAGFNLITSDELNELLSMPTRDRYFSQLVQGK